jgi:hypothetical protein
VLLAVLLPARAWADEAPADAAPACPTPAPRTAHVTLHAEPTVALESHAVGESHWTGVCTAPCNRELPLDADYRVSSDDLRPSGTLRLVAAPGERVTLDVHPVSRRTHTTGLVLLGTGLVLLVAGDVMSDIYLGLEAGQVVDKQAPPKLAAELVWPGIAIAGVGLVAFVTGGVMALRTREPTGVSQSTARPEETAEVDVDVRRAPLWREAASQGAMPRALGVTIASGSF